MGQTDRPDDRRVAGSRLPPTANLLSKEITKRLNPESQNARKSRPAPGFLAKSNTCSRQITAINQRLPNTSRTTIDCFVDGKMDRHALAVAAVQQSGMGLRGGRDDPASVVLQGQRSLDGRGLARHRQPYHAGL